MVFAGWSCVALFFLFAIVKSLLPQGSDGSTEFIIVDYLFMVGMGISWSIFSGVYAFYSWKFSEEEFIEWHIEQEAYGKNWLRFLSELSPKGFVIWQNRIIAPIAFLLGIMIVGYGLFLIVQSVFG